jgi:hypothetical protein
MEVKAPYRVRHRHAAEGTFSHLRSSFPERYFFDTLQRGRDDAISSSHNVRIRMS